jgi:hypothetical protein
VPEFGERWPCSLGRENDKRSTYTHAPAPLLLYPTVLRVPPTRLTGASSSRVHNSDSIKTGGYVKTFAADTNTSRTPDEGAHSPSWPNGRIISSSYKSRVCIILCILTFYSELESKHHDPSAVHLDSRSPRALPRTTREGPTTTRQRPPAAQRIRLGLDRGGEAWLNLEQVASSIQLHNKGQTGRSIVIPPCYKARRGRTGTRYGHTCERQKERQRKSREDQQHG